MWIAVDFDADPSPTSRRPDVLWRPAPFYRPVKSVVSPSDRRGRCLIDVVDPRSAWRNAPQQREGRYAGIIFSLLLNVFACAHQCHQPTTSVAHRTWPVAVWCAISITADQQRTNTHARHEPGPRALPPRHHHHNYTDSGASLSSSPRACQEPFPSALSIDVPEQWWPKLCTANRDVSVTGGEHGYPMKFEASKSDAILAPFLLQTESIIGNYRRAAS